MNTFLPIAFALCTATAAAQGPPAPPNDICMEVEFIQGEGVFAWDNSPNTASGFEGGQTSTTGGQDCTFAIQSDVFFVWTSECCGDYTFDTFGSAINDTMIHVHAGNDCNALCLAGNDNTLGPSLHASVTVFGLDAGDEVLVQVGSASPADVGAGLLTISSATPCPGTWALSVPCDPPNPHHLGGSVSLVDGIVACPPSSSGSTLGTGVGSGLRLQATGGPPGSFGFFLVAPSAGGSLDLFEGVLCLDAPQGRYNAIVATNQGLP